MSDPIEVLTARLDSIEERLNTVEARLERIARARLNSNPDRSTSRIATNRGSVEAL